MTFGVFFTYLLLPPIGLVPLALVGMIVSSVRPRLGRLITLGALLGLLALATPAISGMLLHSLEIGLPTTLPDPASQRADLADQGAVGNLAGAIVILSADSINSAPGSILPRPGLGQLTLERLHAGTILARRLGLPVLVTGGSLSPGQPPIAAMMARTMQQDFGMTPSWIEAQAATTWENAFYSAQILKAAGIRHAYLVTDGWHLRRGQMAFRHFGLEVTPVPSRIHNSPQWGIDEFVPRVAAWQNSYYAVHEWIGCLWYAIRISIGPG